MAHTEATSLPLKRSGAIKWALILGVAILSNVFLTYAVRVFYHEPQYNEYCPETQVVEPLMTKDACLMVGGQWNAAQEVMPQDTTAIKPVPYCDAAFTCRKHFEEATSWYNRNVFIVFAVAGVVLLALSGIGLFSSVISVALSFSGVLSLIIGSLRYWSEMEDWLRVVISGIGLVALFILIGKKFRDE